MNPLLAANSTGTGGGGLAGKYSAPDLDFSDLGNYFILFIVFIAGTFAATSGVGGGAVYMTLLIVLCQLVEEAIPLSKIAVLGCSIAFFFFHIITPPPSRITGYSNRFAYDAVMIMEPATLLGTVYGVMAYRMCPYWLITVTMTLLLALSATKTFEKAKTLSIRENYKLMKLMKEPRTSNYGAVQPSQGEEVLDNNNIQHEWLGTRCFITVLICFVAVLTAAELTKTVDNNTKRAEFTVKCGSLSFWFVIAAVSLVCGMMSKYNVDYLTKNARKAPFNEQCALVWEKDKAYSYAMLCFFAGFLSALCGIGGSTIKGPILLEMGLNPTLAKATAQLMLLTTVSSSAFQFYTVGDLPPNYAIALFSIAVLASFTGKYTIDLYIARGGRQSVIVYLLAFYIVIAATLMTGIAAVIILGQLIPDIKWSQLWFRGLCEPLPSDKEALRFLYYLRLRN